MKTITVRLHRQTRLEAGPGELRAYVVQGGMLGSNLFPRRMITRVETAKAEVTAILRDRLPEFVIEFEGPEGEDAPQG